MKWIEEMKETLKFAHKAFTTCEGEFCPEAEERIVKALAAIPEEPEMVKLLRHIRAEHSFHLQRAGAFYKMRKWADRHFERGQTIMCTELILYIEEEFGYRLEHE